MFGVWGSHTPTQRLYPGRMDARTGDSPERLLSAALRAQAAGGGAPAAEQPALPLETVTPAGPRQLPVLRVLLFALVLGLLAGGIVGFLSFG
jgi:hypothetical protein